MSRYKETMSDVMTKKTDDDSVITEKRVVTKAKKSAVSVMYIGPNVLNVVRKSTVFKNGVYPEALKAFIKEHPYTERLLIPLDSLAGAMKELAIEKSALSVIYNKVKSFND